MKLDEPSTQQVIDFYRRFAEVKSHSYRIEVSIALWQILISACIFLVSKIQEDDRKIRDIVNVCYVVTTLYKKANILKENEDIEYLSFEFMRDALKDPEVVAELVPSFSLEKVWARTIQYNEFKKDILEAEQYLLRILNYNLDSCKHANYRLLLSYMHHFKRSQSVYVVPKPICELMMKVYNDSIFARVKESPKACMHFSIQLALNWKQVEQEELDQVLLQEAWWQGYMECSLEEL